jgi:iron complex transport system permease protein
MKRTKPLFLGILCALVIICAGTSIGTSNIGITDTIGIIIHKIAAVPLREGMDPKNVPIVWLLRLPRVLFAFMIGGSLAMSGVVFQSVLKNPLASPYILGVSSGASLGAGLIMLYGVSIPFIGSFTLPLAGFVFGILTVYFVITFSAKIDKTLSNNTVILFGMVVSLFVNGILTMLIALFREELKSLIIWQMGSFALKSWSYGLLMLPFFVIGTAGIIGYTREMDILTFGEEQAQSLGVDTRKTKIKLFFFSTVLTGGAVALSGAIGFIDLIAPHLARKLVGARHHVVIPMAFIIGGSLMVTADLAARTLVSPSELPVGAITAVIGAPFFAWVYFRKRQPG